MTNLAFVDVARGIVARNSQNPANTHHSYDTLGSGSRGNKNVKKTERQKKIRWKTVKKNSV